ncbi:MAG: PIG-L family deacetylase [Desulfobacteraceae bacterium]|nr:PIG-L family deacetylase [Desulfobacteraceae bacterium]
MKGKILVVAAHPDDGVLGCGGTVARLTKSGCKVHALILGQGIAARYEKNNRQKVEIEIKKIRKHVYAANEIIGIKEVFIHDFPDNKFDTVPLLDIVKIIEKVKNDIKPNIIFTHYEKDLNIDHQLTYKAVITATRPLPNEVVKEIYSFEVLSSTEWSYPTVFSPDVFFDISETIDVKTKAMRAYKSELTNFPHPRSLEGLESNAKTWGMKVGVQYAEAFEVVRVLR